MNYNQESKSHICYNTFDLDLFALALPVNAHQNLLRPFDLIETACIALDLHTSCTVFTPLVHRLGYTSMPCFASWRITISSYSSIPR